MTSLTIKAISSLLAAQQLDHTFIQDSEPMIIAKNAAFMVYFDRKVQSIVIMSSLLGSARPVLHEDALWRALEHILALALAKRVLFERRALQASLSTFP